MLTAAKKAPLRPAPQSPENISTSGLLGEKCREVRLSMLVNQLPAEEASRVDDEVRTVLLELRKIVETTRRTSSMQPSDINVVSSFESKAWYIQSIV
ncbi:hypothetical protein AgCh_025069 [Apium graveolens]